MKKRNWIILAVLIVILLIFLVSSFLLRSCFGCSNPCDYSDFYKKAIKYNNESMCSFIEAPSKPTLRSTHQGYDVYCREACFRSIAIYKNDSSICGLISNVKTEFNLSGPTIKDSCYNGLAKNLKQFSLCNLTETNWAKKYCPW